jgi:pimeloyl-ACP methyl ester carboxylesterase
MVISAGFIANPMKRPSWVVRPLTTPLMFRLPAPSSLLKHYLVGQNPPDALEASVRSALKMVDPRVLSKRVRALLECDAREDLARTEIPILYLQAEADNLVGPECFEEIRRIRPDVALVSVPAPHLLLQTQPERAAQAIMQFIRQIPA